MFVSIFDKLDETSATPAYLGGKGHGLWWMQQQGVNVPPALIIPTTVCVEYMKTPKKVMAAVEMMLPQVYEFFNQQFGHMPLLSVRSGARVSMPGMMDTILNVGLDPSNEQFWRGRLGEQCAGDCMVRLIEMYGNVVKGIARDGVEHTPATALLHYHEKTGEGFPAAKEQLLNSIEAVFKSWNNERAVYYRRMHGIDDTWGTAVVLQAMVFGNLNDQSATGVLFTRNPDTGENKITGEFLVNAQGEDVVAGIRTPLPLTQMAEWSYEVSEELAEAVKKLEVAKKDVQDVEFTIQGGKLYVLQTRNAKRTAKAAIKIAVDMVHEGLITREQAFKRVTRAQFHVAQQPVIDPKFKDEPKATGIPACSGVATGIAVDAAGAIDCTEPFVLVGEETTPDDIKWMDKSVGILTMTGGATSHAAVVARSMDKPCVVGLGGKVADYLGQQISIDGATGRVWLSKVPVIDGGSEEVKAFEQMMWDATGAIPINCPGPQTLVDVTDELTIGHVGSAVNTVLFALNTSQVIVQMEAHRLAPENEFFAMFAKKGAQAKHDFLKALVALPEKKREKITLFGESVQGLKTLTKTSDPLAMLAADGPVIYDGPKDALSEKVIKAKTALGEKVLADGHGLLSRSRLVALLLA